MIAYSDTSQLYLAAEPKWGAAPSSPYIRIPYNRETLTPLIRNIYPANLKQDNAPPPPIRAEEAAAGDVEMLATTSNLNLLIPKILQTTAVQETKSIGQFNANSKGVVNLGGLSSKLKINDFAFVKASGGHDGWGQVIAGIKTGKASMQMQAFPSNYKLPSGAKLSLNAYSPAQETSSISFYKTYRDGKEWFRLNGGMLSRLTLDLAEGELMKIGASVIGKELAITTSAPSVKASTDTPLGFSSGLKTFSISDGTTENTITQDNSIVTGFRLVIERVGMTPQYALGDTKPAVILPGELAVYGVVDLLIGDYQLFRWMDEEKPLTLSFAIEDDAGGGAAFYLAEIRLSDVDVPIAGNGEPLRARFQFEAFPKDDAPMIKAFIEPSS